jgi:hypothetical protein
MNQLSTLQALDLFDYGNLTDIPRLVYNLESLMELNLSYCPLENLDHGVNNIFLKGTIKNSTKLQIILFVFRRLFLP